MIREIEKLVCAKTTVLIQGESGTGKELVALALHENSPRHAGPFEDLNCAVLSEGLIERNSSATRKAFTGAVERMPGVFERANRGTVFLDEIGELPLAAQAKLLRVIEQRKLRRLGGTQWISVDVRIVAAINRNLEATVAAGKFREDLFHRLNVARLQTTPLRERVCDIPALVRHFIERKGG